MNSSTHNTHAGFALTAALLALTVGCGSQVSSAPSDISQPAGPKPGSTSQQCHGSPQQGGFVCEPDPPRAGSGGGGTGGLARPGTGPEGWS